MKKLLLILILGFTTQAFAQEEAPGDIYIKVGEAKVKKSILAFPPLNYIGGSIPSEYKTVAADLYNTIQNDLEVSNLFTFMDQKGFLEDTSKVGLTPAPANAGGFDFEKWKTVGADFLFRGAFKVNIGKKLEFEVYVYYIPQQKVVIGKKYESDLKEVRQTAHTFVDDLMKALTGKRGIFKTKFAVASDKAGNGWKEIYVMDWDGRNSTGITNHKSISMSPSWSPNGKTVAYTSFAYHPSMKSRNADLFTYDIYEGKRFLVSSRRGLNSGSNFAPDGQSIFMTITSGGDPDIYKVSIDGDELTKITNSSRGILNVEPNVSKDGRKVVFSSDRGGNPMIYTMNIDGSGVKRMTFAGKYNSSPCWSPDGKKIAFAGRDKDHFDIFIIDEDGTNMQRLTSAKKPNGHAADNEDPSFSPDGRYIAFTSNRSGKNQIYIVSTDGTMERRITVDNHNYFKPRWSPYLN